ncbi:uncharacterized protein LOC133165435 [Syngnathus typhle]|uniref:uncharacterized protein LOC133165435 n=1 Tax=Syngnathus typhle TaxID=161592 RepID=UPI002A6B1CA1|nr:uncharacterized protein LOC133165435 [Syngnathus typhle]XP_061151078.1 uncharacterized protein LOC133165435 [Syngnathus typhle]XP_061151079.1 uncharacterized protein LOC133165435 [Syngnathus typhle]XP_061151080.1 uncharacterized protein LOC133165435 [Syngnathus typhle]
MQACARMAAPSWDSSADKIWNYPSTQNPHQYQTHGGADWSTTFSSQDGRCYQNASHVPHTGFSNQQSSGWSPGASSCPRRDVTAYQNPSSALQALFGMVRGHSVVPEQFCQNPSSYPHNGTLPTSFPGPNSNQTPWPQPDARSTLQNPWEIHPRRFVQDDTQWYIRHSAQAVETQAKMAERTSLGKHAQCAPYSSPHTMQTPKPQPVQVLRVPRESSQSSKPHRNRKTPPNPKALKRLKTARSSRSLSTRPTVDSVRPVRDGSPQLAGQIPSGLSCNDQTASPVREQQDHRAPPQLQPEEPEGREERPLLQSLATRKWTCEDLDRLVRYMDQDSEKSPECPVRPGSDDIIATFWKDKKILVDKIRAGFYYKIMAETFTFSREHVTSDSVVLSEPKCDSNLSGFRVLRDGEVYSEPPYSSFWCNVNPQPHDLLDHAPVASQPLSSAPETAAAQSPEGEQEPLEPKEDEKTQQARVLDSPGEDSDVYSFVIEVLPQEQAKAIYESINHAEETPAKGDPQGSAKTATSADKGEKDLFESELESFFEQWKDILSEVKFSPKQERAQNETLADTRWQNLDFSVLGVDADDRSLDSNQSHNASPLIEQKDHQETGKFGTQNDHAWEKLDDREMSSQQDERELAHISQQDEQETGKFSQQDEPETGKVSQQDEPETGTVPQGTDTQSDKQVTGKVSQQRQEEKGTATQPDEQETVGKVSQQKHEETATTTQQTTKVSPKDNVRERTNVSVLPSKVSCPPHGHRSRGAKVYRGERTLCLAGKRVAAAKKKRKKSKQSVISVAFMKKLKIHLVRRDVSKHSKEAATAKLVLFGSAGRGRSCALDRRAPEVLSVSAKSRSSAKQRIYEAWCLPPVKIDGKSKVQSRHKSFADVAGKDPPLPTLAFRKAHGRMSVFDPQHKLQARRTHC